MARLGIQANELAEKVGVKPSAVSNWLTGTNPAKGKNLRALAEVLGVEPGWLLGEEPSESTMILREDSTYGDSSSERMFKRLTTPTLQQSLGDLVESLKKASTHDRKHILGNIRAALDVLEERELQDPNLRSPSAVQVGAKKGADSIPGDPSA